jgi:acyl-CoA hydrolase
VNDRPATEPGAVLVKWMGITDANSAGFIHGGTVMKLCDEAAGLAAVRHSRLRVVTAAVDRMTFLHPVFVGELLTLNARVNAVWRTSMEVGVRVEAENPRTGDSRQTGTAYFTMVAIDEDGQPTEVPDVPVENEDQERRAREAQVRRANRLAERDELRAGRGD